MISDAQTPHEHPENSPDVLEESRVLVAKRKREIPEKQADKSRITFGLIKFVNYWEDFAG